MPHLIRSLFSKLTNRLSENHNPIELNAHQADWLIRSGLLPCAHYTQVYRCNDPKLRLHMEAALLSFRLIGNNMVKVYSNINQNFTRATSPLIPLKGIDICTRYYPHPWLRPMRDIDILVDKSDIAAYLDHVLAFGFSAKPSRKSKDFYEKHHHLAPLYHPQLHCWLEIHTGLFSPESSLGQDDTFQPHQVRQHLSPDPVSPHMALLTPEFLLVYVAAHWADDLKFDSGALSLLDIALIVQRENIDWPQTLKIAGHPLVAGYLLLALTLLNRILPSFVPEKVIKQLRCQAPQFNRFTLGICYYLLERYMLNSHSFTAATRHTVPLFVENLIKPHSPIHNLVSAVISLIAPHRGHLPFWQSVRHRLSRLPKINRTE